MGIRRIDLNTNVGVNSSAFNNSNGVVLHGGNVAASNNFDNLALGETAKYMRASPVVQGVNNQKAISAGNFNVFVKGHYVMAKVTTTLAGLARTQLQSGSSFPGLRRKVNSVGSIRTNFLSGLSWVHGNDLPAYTSTYVNTNVTFWSISGGAASATADNATLATTKGNLLGELTYHTGADDPTNDEYATQQ